MNILETMLSPSEIEYIILNIAKHLHLSDQHLKKALDMSISKASIHIFDQCNDPVYVTKLLHIIKDYHDMPLDYAAIEMQTFDFSTADMILKTLLQKQWIEIRNALHYLIKCNEMMAHILSQTIVLIAMNTLKQYLRKHDLSAEDFTDKLVRLRNDAIMYPILKHQLAL